MKTFNNDWTRVLSKETNKKYFLDLLISLEKLYTEKEIYPVKEELFKAFELTSFENLKVVIIGQDPYHGEGQAEGLAFSVKKGLKLPPSLRNIYKELESDLGIKHQDGSLVPWAKEGVLLLNAILSVEKNKAASHRYLPWERFTDTVISKISTEKEKLVFILWGNYAISKKTLIDEDKHLVLSSSHPSPFSARHSFFGSKVFSKTNAYLKANDIKEINW